MLNSSRFFTAIGQSLQLTLFVDTWMCFSTLMDIEFSQVVLVGIYHSSLTVSKIEEIYKINSLRKCWTQYYTEKILLKDPVFFCETWWISMKRACMRRPWTFIRMREFFRLSIASVDGKYHLSEVVFSALVGLSLYTTSSHHRNKQSAKSTTEMSSVAYVMLCGARVRSCGQQTIGASIMIMLQDIPDILDLIMYICQGTNYKFVFT